jgi:hypothetical protein
LTFKERFIDIISDPNNIYIKRCENAGKVNKNIITLHNNIQVYKDSYYNDFTDILILNKGCHEPAEERMFNLILEDISENGVMIELGSYWAFYTIWFNKAVKNAKNYCIEPNPLYLNCGKKHCLLNNVKAEFIQGFVGKNKINIPDFMKKYKLDNVDLLHCDIQGYELDMLTYISTKSNLLKENKIKYLFISTHSDDIHYKCIDILTNNDYRIIASADYETESFCYDGLIVACHISNNKFGTINLGNRKHTKLRTVPYMSTVQLKKELF